MPYNCRIDGRPIDDLTLSEADALSAKKHAEAQQHIRLAVERSGETSELHRRLGTQAMEDALVLDKILEYAVRK